MSKVPTDFRRVTMLIPDMDAALKIYRDILGMEVYYDNEIIVSGEGLPAGEPDSKTHLVILKCNDPYIGMLGLLQYVDPPLPPPLPRPEPNRVWEQLQDVEGVEAVCPPRVTEYPKDDGSVFRVKGISFFDPNGYFIELNQWV